MKIHHWLIAFIMFVPVAFVGCTETNRTNDGLDTEVESIDPEAEVEVTPEGEADVELDPEVTPQEGTN